jgi:serine/threonine protein kinase
MRNPNAAIPYYPFPCALPYRSMRFATIPQTTAAVHAAKWLHGDVKPQNIFISADGLVWLGDYGSSQRYEDIAKNYCEGTPQFQCSDINVLEVKAGGRVFSAVYIFILY